MEQNEIRCFDDNPANFMCKQPSHFYGDGLVWFMVLKCTFQQYFSYIVADSFIGGGNQSTWGKIQTCCKSLTNFITYKCCIEYTSPWTGFELTTLVVIGTDCTGSCKSNYHTIKTAPLRRKLQMNRIDMKSDCKSSAGLDLFFLTIRLWKCWQYNYQTI